MVRPRSKFLASAKKKPESRCRKERRQQATSSNSKARGSSICHGTASAYTRHTSAKCTFGPCARKFLLNLCKRMPTTGQEAVQSLSHSQADRGDSHSVAQGNGAATVGLPSTERLENKSAFHGRKFARPDANTQETGAAQFGREASRSIFVFNPNHPATPGSLGDVTAIRQPAPADVRAIAEALANVPHPAVAEAQPGRPKKSKQKGAYHKPVTQPSDDLMPDHSPIQPPRWERS